MLTFYFWIFKYIFRVILNYRGKNQVSLIYHVYNYNNYRIRFTIISNAVK